MEKAAGKRLHCLVPFCRRTRGQRKGEPPIRPGKEWICGVHWRHVSRFKKRHRARLLRLIRKAEKLNRTSVETHLRDRFLSLWAEMKREAIEAAGGIG